MKQEIKIAAAFVALMAVASIIGTGWYWASAPARVVSKTLDTTNIITSYERFIDLNGIYEARVAQVRDLETQVALDTKAGIAGDTETRTDLNTIRQSCREIAAAYNADAIKINKSAFQDRNIPSRLDAGKCEASK